MNIDSNIINRYDDLLYENRPVSLNEFLTNKYNNVHTELYNSALDNYIHSLVDKYVTNDLIYEYYELMSKLNIMNDDNIIFDDIYNTFFYNESHTPFINNLLNDLSLDRYTFFKLFYEITINRLNIAKNKLLNFYTDNNYNILSAIEGISEISDIHDFRFGYIMTGIGNEESDKKDLYNIYVDDNNELIISDKILIDDHIIEAHQKNYDRYYYVGEIMPTSNSDIYNDEGWRNTNDTTNIILPNGIYYVCVPNDCGIYRMNYNVNEAIDQISLGYKSMYTFVKSIIINDTTYNIYITTINSNVFKDIIQINNVEYIINNEYDDIFDLICSENSDYIILYDSLNNVRIGYDSNGKWLLILNAFNQLNNEIDENILRKQLNQYINYESKNVINEYKNMICDLYKRYHKIIEIKNSEYWMPSLVRIINKIPPYSKITVNLSDYWNYIQSNDNSKIDDLKISKDNLKDSELIEINYIRGKAKLQSRTTGIIYEVPFKYLDENINVSDDMLLSNTFVSKYNNL